MSTLHITRGLPASGKTTWARSWLAESPSTRVRVNRDDLRAMLFDQPTYGWEQEQLVTEAGRAIVRAAFAAGRDVVVDDTNLRPKYVREWMRFANAHGAHEVEVHEFYLPIDGCIERDAARDRTVGEHVIQTMAGKYLRRSGVSEHHYDFLPLVVDEPATAPATETYEPREGAQAAVIVDIDGTLALHNGRDPYDLDRCGDDLPNRAVIEAVRAAAADGMTIVYCSGRENRVRALTLAWIDLYVGVTGPLFMRDSGDRRKDAIVKRELFDQGIRDHYDVRYVLDDRQQVVDMWRELGLTVFQVARGDF